LRLLNLPHALPKKGTINQPASPQGYDIDPESELLFDFFGKGFRSELQCQSLVMAPFSSANKARPADQSILHDFVVNGEDDPESRLFQAAISVVCDGCDIIVRRVALPFLRYPEHITEACVLEIAVPQSSIHETP
jgi:hypothetical protein